MQRGIENQTYPKRHNSSDFLCDSLFVVNGQHANGFSCSLQTIYPHLPFRNVQFSIWYLENIRSAIAWSDWWISCISPPEDVGRVTKLVIIANTLTESLNFRGLWRSPVLSFQCGCHTGTWQHTKQERFLRHWKNWKANRSSSYIKTSPADSENLRLQLK